MSGLPETCDEIRAHRLQIREELMRFMAKDLAYIFGQEIDKMNWYEDIEPRDFKEIEDESNEAPTDLELDEDISR